MRRFWRTRTSDDGLAAMTAYEGAGYWFVRQDASLMSEDDRRKFEAWLAEDDAHRQAYGQANAIWADLERSADQSELRALRVAALAVEPTPNVWPRAAAIAAGILAVVGLAVLVGYTSAPRRLDARLGYTRSSSVRYFTAHNQRSTVTLPDGTLVSMNLDTALDTDFSADRRSVRLTRGQAFFNVAKDGRRPFVVTAADRNIQALGTQFDVRLDANRIEVVLLEGRVRVDQTDQPLVDRIVHRPARVEMTPGQRLVASIGHAPAVAPTNATQTTSWREGWVVFQDAALEQAIAELNRYSDQPIVASDERVKRLRLSGVFRIGQPERFGAIIQELLPVEVKHGTHGETVLVPRSDSVPRSDQDLHAP